MRVTLQKELTPEKFVQPVPLPIPSHKGLCIQARSDVVYNATVPTRDIVRRDNYRRRQMQLSMQGFHAVNFRPYQGIGDPFYLGEKRLILHALGQWDENQVLDDSSSSSDSSDDEERLNQQNQQTKAVIPANFVLRRSRKDLNTLPKEVSHGRDMIRNVRLGHGLFQILRKDRQMKSEAKQQEIIRKRDLMRSEWQPPKDSSSEDDSEEEFHDVEMNSYGVDLTSDRLELVPTMVEEGEESQNEENIPLMSDINTDQNVSDNRNVGFMNKVDPSAADGEKSQRSGRSSRKRQQNSRPYTPGHSNIGADDNVWPDKNALFRQLCCLHWLLEAMNVEPPVVMAPITTCWNFKDVGGARTTPSKGTKDRMESRWKTFSTDLRLKLAEEQERMRELMQVQQLIGRDQDKHTLLQTLKKVDAESVEELQAAVHHMHSSITALRTKILQEQQPDLGESISSASERKRSLYYKRKSSARLLPFYQHSSESVGRRSRAVNVKPRRTSGNIRNSLTASPAGSVCRLQASSPNNMRRDLTIPEDSEVSDVDEIDKSFLMDDLATSRTQNTVQDDKVSVAAEVASVKSEMSTKPGVRKSSSKEKTELIASSRRPTATSRQEKESQQQRSQSPQMTRAQILELITRREEDPGLAKLIYIQEKRTCTTMRAEANVRPKSSTELLEHVANLPSTKVTHMPRMMRQKFAEVGQEKALVLHDILEAVERERMRKMQRKFTHMASSRSVHRALDQMRSKSSCNDEDEGRLKQRKSRIYQQWYLDIDHAVPDELKQDWYFTKIMSRLGKYGLVEASKQSTFKFIKVLTGLRDWEICSPDITAAIEFCRAKIVEMSVEEYEDFFMQQFPTVVRPNTAPPASKHSKGSGVKGSGRGAEKQRDVARSRVMIKSQSAPVGSRTPHA